MTSSMIITLGIVVLMVVVIISDKLPFGAPALLAAALLVVFNQADIATAFSGFTDSNVIMIMGFMACMAALQKTTLIHNLQGFLGNVAKRGGIAGFAILMLAIMAAGNLISGTAFYVLVINVVATIPYTKELPTSRLVLPAACASGASGWLPSGAAMMIGLVASLCASAGYEGNATIPVMQYCLINIIWSGIYLVWSVIGHKMLPDRDISDTAAKAAEARAEAESKKFVPVLTKTQENVVYVGYVVLLLSMFFLQKFPGNIGYGIPLVIAGIFLVAGIYNFSEMLKNMFSPVMIMMASVIGVAAAMSNCGLSDFLGGKIANLLGANPSMFVLVLVFALLTSIMATFTGASFGSLFIFAPIGISLCMNYGYNPVPLVYACVRAAWINYFMPIDGMPALAMGMGKYKLVEFWKYVIPMWVMNILCMSGLGVLFFA